MFLKLSEYGEEALEIASIFDATNFTENTRRQLKEVGVQPLPEDEERELSNIISEMGKVYGATKVCIDGVEDGNQCYNLEPGLTDIMAESTNFTLRTLVWEVSINALCNLNLIIVNRHSHLGFQSEFRRNPGTFFHCTGMYRIRIPKGKTDVCEIFPKS